MARQRPASRGPRARVHVMVQDPAVAAGKGIAPTEVVEIGHEDFFLDGPVSRRVAVVDLDPRTGDLAPGLAFVPPRRGALLGRYEVALHNLHAPAFMAGSVFGTVMLTLRMFEEDAGLGRRMHWAFDGPQLLVVPRAGDWPNAFYERESRSLQFFSFDADGTRVHTCLSRDIVAHETGHAILDGIAPDLYHALTPQALALHEAVADLVALLVSFRSRALCEAVLSAEGGSIEDSTAFNSIAEEFGGAIDATKRTGYLRTLLNTTTLDDVAADEPHELSLVLSGALYRVLVGMHGRERRRGEARGEPPLAAAGRALRVTAERFKRLVLRALDYLPPGEVSFADYGRALYAADRAAFPRHPEHRDRIAKELVGRGVVDVVEQLTAPAAEVGTVLAGVDPDALLHSDWAAYAFANNHRELLGIPDGQPFRLRPRAAVTKMLTHPGGRRSFTDELLFKVAWDEVEPNGAGSGLPRDRQVGAGATLVLDPATCEVRALLRTDRGEQHRAARDGMIERLVHQELLAVDELGAGPDGADLRAVVRARTVDGVLRLEGTARTLHLTGA